MNKALKVLFLLFVASHAHAQYNSLLWKISGNGLEQPSYLYGTMHTADERVIKLSDKAMKYFKTSKAFAMELDPKEAFDMSLIGKLMMGKGYSLKQMIPAKDYHMLDSVISAQMGFSLALFDNVAPVFIMTIFETVGMGLKEGGGKQGEVLDLYFYNKAKKDKKKLIGIETVDEQLGALNIMSYEEQAEMLTKEVRDYSEKPGDEGDVLRFYLQQNLDSLASQNMDSLMPEKFYKALVTDRNIRMANRIGNFVAEQSTFIGIGALHLPGKEGVIELLRRKGFVLEVVK